MASVINMNSYISVLFVAILVNFSITTQGITIDREEIDHQDEQITKDLSTLNSTIIQLNQDSSKLAIRRKRSERCTRTMGLTSGVAPFAGALLGTLTG